MAWPAKPSRTGTGQRYGPHHRQARANAARHHHPHDPCVRCGQPLGPMSQHLHYDHDEQGGYLGFSHAHCNRKAGSHKANTRRQPRQPRRQSRAW